MSDFLTAFKETMNTEGTYANDPADNGGETYAGVSRKNWPAWGGWVVIDELRHTPNFPECLDQNKSLQEFVQNFYYVSFWMVLGLNQIESQPIATELFDLGVNCGTATAATFLQRSLNVLNKDQKFYQDLTVDGSVGSNTLIAVSKANEMDLLRCIVSLQGARYISICEKNGTQEKFMAGWIRRAFKHFSYS